MEGLLSMGPTPSSFYCIYNVVGLGGSIQARDKINDAKYEIKWKILK